MSDREYVLSIHPGSFESWHMGNGAKIYYYVGFCCVALSATFADSDAAWADAAARLRARKNLQNIS